MTTVLLLDIDGVLVKPGGYRAALHATLNYFVNLMGLPHFEFPEEKLAGFERRGITSEWDMVPLLLGVLWNDILSHYPTMRLPSEVSSAAIEWGITLMDMSRRICISLSLSWSRGSIPPTLP